MKNQLLALLVFFTQSVFTQSYKPELVISKERVEPGIIFVFEGAIKDHIMPNSMHLSENETHVHIEARVNWDTVDVPSGAIMNGFIPYLYINTKLVNETTGLSTFIDLVPHINLIDNFHYARNISLPGSIDDLYTVHFNIIPPTKIDLSLHKDWAEKYGNEFLKELSFKYQNINFKEIANATRK